MTSRSPSSVTSISREPRPLFLLERDVLQRAHDLADRLGGDAGVERRGVELGVVRWQTGGSLWRRRAEPETKQADRMLGFSDARFGNGPLDGDPAA
jgi:hypothetical protein